LLPEYGLGTGPESFSKKVQANIFKMKRGLTIDTSVPEEYWGDSHELRAALIGCGVAAGLELGKSELEYVSEYVQVDISELGNLGDWVQAVNKPDLTWMRCFSKTPY
jgi:hypothetical protein